MNKMIKNIFSLALLAAATSFVGCSQSNTDTIESGYGVAMHVSLTTANGESIVTRSGDDTAFDYSKAMENSVLKIYDSADRLLRRYEPISSMPEVLYLTKGDYRVTVVAGESLSPVEGQENLTFKGESSFKVTAAQTSSVSVDCPMINNALSVKFDSSLSDNLEPGYSLLVAQAAEIDDTVLEDGFPYKKVFTETGVTYFIQPQDITTLAWKFEGILKSSGDKVVSKTGVINDVVAREINYLTFSYEKRLLVSNTKISVDTSTDDKNDIFEFSPQPTINGSDFEITAVQKASGRDFVMNIDGIYALTDVNINYGGVIVAPLVDGQVVATEGVSYTAVNEKSGKLTIAKEYLSNINAGGDQTIAITAVDIKASKGEKDFLVTTTGVVGLSNIDFWANSATISATLVDPAITAANTTLEYRTKGNEAWSSFALAAASGDTYTAAATSRWSAAKQNAAGLTYYTPDEGFFPNTEYECRLVVDGVAKPAVTVKTANVSQSIPYADFSDAGLPCWGSSSSGSTTWGSGNNSFVDDLCRQATRGGSVCAYMKASNPLVFAAGNLFFGQFKFNGIVAQTGTVRFGQPFDWTTRPRSLKLKYSATVGGGEFTVNGVTHPHDRGRIYFAIVDWTKRREVTAGKGAPTGVWDPETTASVDEGSIIGYASLYIDESTAGDGMHDLELPIFYYDTETKPSKSITMLISCATSAYGDYLVGSTDSRLWVDDFAFGY